MPSSADIASVAEQTLRAIIEAAAAAPRPVVLIDGRSGAGKTMLAARVADSLGAQLLALDSVYPGWDGLARGAADVCDGVLEPLARGVDGTWTRWDWSAGEPAEAHLVRADRPLVVEGSGVLTPRARALSDVQVWLDADPEPRKARALARDGETYLPHWERWAAQEDAHIAAHDPVALASIVARVP